MQVNKAILRMKPLYSSILLSKSLMKSSFSSHRAQTFSNTAKKIKNDVTQDNSSGNKGKATITTIAFLAAAIAYKFEMHTSEAAPKEAPSKQKNTVSYSKAAPQLSPSQNEDQFHYLKSRLTVENPPNSIDTGRSDFERDYGRVIHSLHFRLLSGKTQLFPSGERDTYRHRLSHSMEVAQISRGIFNKLLKDKRDGKNYFPFALEDRVLVETAALAHDIGHPPFAHAGEKILDQLMDKYGGFEGNAQSFRIITHLAEREKKCEGLNLTIGTLLSILKANYKMRPPGVSKQDMKKKREGANLEERKQKGYYDCDKGKVNEILKLTDKPSSKETELLDGFIVDTEFLTEYHNLLYRPVEKNGNEPDWELKKEKIKKMESYQFVGSQIMDTADDITNSTYDLIDALDLGFLTVLDFLSPNNETVDRVANAISKNPEYGSKIENKEVEIILKGIGEDMVLFCVKECKNPEYGSRIKNKEVEEDDQIAFCIKECLKTKNLTPADIGSASRCFRNNESYRMGYSSKILNEFIGNLRWDKEQGLNYGDKNAKNKMFVLKHFIYEKVIRHRSIQAWENGAEVILRELFERLTADLDKFREEMWIEISKNPNQNSDDRFSKFEKRCNEKKEQIENLLPPHEQKIFSETWKKMEDDIKNETYKIEKVEHTYALFSPVFRVICDFISGMTDKYAHEYHARLTGKQSVSVLKPF